VSSSGDETAVDATASPVAVDTASPAVIPLNESPADDRETMLPVSVAAATEGAAAVAAAACLGDTSEVPHPPGSQVTLVSHIRSLVGASAEAASVVVAAAVDSWGALHGAWEGPGAAFMSASTVIRDAGSSTTAAPASASAPDGTDAQLHVPPAWHASTPATRDRGRHNKKKRHGQEDPQEQQVAELGDKAERVLSLAVQPVLLVAALTLAAVDTVLWRVQSTWSSQSNRQQWQPPRRPIE
jgi:hypothetical protein